MAFAGKSAKSREFLNETGLYDYALEALGRRMRSESDLRRLMRQRVETGERGEEIVTAVLGQLKERGYLNDKSFAEAYARLRQENEKFGQRRVKQDLMQKGVAPDLVNETIEARYAETNEESLARKYLDRKRIQKPENEKETARVMRRLVAAGFSTGTIYRILRQWDVPDEALAALDNISEDFGDGGED